MPPTRVALVPHHGKGEVVVRAYECLRLAGIAPVGYTFNAHSFILLSPNTRQKAMTALLAAGFEIIDEV